MTARSTAPDPSMWCKLYFYRQEKWQIYDSVGSKTMELFVATVIWTNRRLVPGSDLRTKSFIFVRTATQVLDDAFYSQGMNNRNHTIGSTERAFSAPSRNGYFYRDSNRQEFWRASDIQDLWGVQETDRELRRIWCTNKQCFQNSIGLNLTIHTSINMSLDVFKWEQRVPAQEGHEGQRECRMLKCW